MAETSYAIALGSNRRHGRHGAPKGVVRAAIAGLSELGRIDAASGIRATPALGPAGRSFANAVAILATDLAPDALLDALKRIERDFGRRRGRRWGARVLDLDIILWSEGAWGGPGPIIPHPHYRERDFVLVPLAQIAPGWRDPLTGATVRQLLARLTRPAPAHR
ncbi:MAG: 2-amino-4-hydroxy-6-hydroxymethyldihydropteridine diphosphokinase [Sphingosinicella sp.]|uniref:2-amino-4-hydroxy-6- hydroxymethyldihydropteridine diphosphokinase n=1 Tax=Sphingosinicella sp. TaxID=1917971 RepID=UPI004037C37F